MRISPIANGVSMRWLEDVALPYQGEACLIWPFHRNHLGRPVMRVNYRTTYACRIVCERAHGLPPTEKHVAAHSCGNGHDGCINPRHLHWATRKENSLEMVEHGRSTRGSVNARSKLTEAEVLEIRRQAESGVPRRALAETYCVSKGAIHAIVQRRRWSWL